MVTCTASFGATCPTAAQLAAVDELAVGITLANFPAGGVVKLTAKASAPATPQTIEFASAIDIPIDAPDSWAANNLTNVSKTIVSTPIQCTATLSTANISVTSGSTSAPPTQVTLTAPASCSWTVTSSQPWARLGPASGTGSAVLTVGVDANTLDSPRQATFTSVADSNPGVKSAALVLQSAAPRAPTPVSTPVCTDVLLGREAEQLGPNIVQGNVSIVAAACMWEARSTQSWIAITRSANGVGGGSVQYQVQANQDSAERKGAIVVAGKRLDIVQAGTATLAAGTSDSANGDGGGDGGGGDGGGSGGDSG